MRIGPEAIAVVTGAGSGIGRALALELSLRGVRGLALADVNERGLAHTEVLASRQGVRVTTHLVDVSNAERVAQFAREVRSEHGGASFLVNNAGVALGGTFEEYSLNDIEWLMGINFWGVVYGCHAFLPMLRQQPSAHVVNVSSIFGILAPPTQTAYSASKFAVRGFSEALRHELSGSNVHLSVVHPGGIKTNIARSARVASHSKVSPDEALKQAVNFERSFITSPQGAALTILEGVERNAARILVGPDAKFVDSIVRFLPGTYWNVLERMLPK